MARLKKTSPILEAARVRLAGLKSLTSAPDFGPDLTIAGYEADIKALSDKIADYNQLLSTLDLSLNEVQDLERPLAVKSGRILAATKGRYGPDSTEYEQVGGTRTSDRKRSGPRKKDPAAGGNPTST